VHHDVPAVGYRVVEDHEAALVAVHGDVALHDVLGLPHDREGVAEGRQLLIALRHR